jgi:hypothetical protein
LNHLSVLTYNQFKRFLPLPGDIVHVEKSRRFDVDVVLKSLFMRLGELSDDICKRFDSEITMVTIWNVSWCVNNKLYYFVLVALNHLNIRITNAAPELDTITQNWTYKLLV